MPLLIAVGTSWDWSDCPKNPAAYISNSFNYVLCVVIYSKIVWMLYGVSFPKAVPDLNGIDFRYYVVNDSFP